MVGVGEEDSTDAVGVSEGHGAVHGGVGVEVARAEIAVPALDGSEGGDEGGFGLGVNDAVLDGGDEAGEACEAVGVNAVAGSFGEEAGAELGARRGEGEGKEGGFERGGEFGIGYAEHWVSGPSIRHRRLGWCR